MSRGRDLFRLPVQASSCYIQRTCHILSNPSPSTAPRFKKNFLMSKLTHLSAFLLPPIPPKGFSYFNDFWSREEKEREHDRTDQMEAEEKKGIELLTKGKRESHRQTEPSRDRSIAEAGTQRKPLSLRETKRLMEPEVQLEGHRRSRDKGGGGGRRAYGAGLIPVLCVRENPLTMQMTLGVTLEGHLLCAPWVVAEREREWGGAAPPPGPIQIQSGPHSTPPQSSALGPQPIPSSPASLFPEEASK